MSARPAYPLSSSSIRGLSLFLFERVTLTKGTGTDESTSSAQRLNFVSRRAKALTSGPVSTSVVTSGPGAWSGELPRWSEPEAPNRPSRKIRRAARPQSFASHQPRAGWPRGPSHWRSAPAAPRHRRDVFCRPPAGAPKVLQSICVCNTSAMGRQMRVAPPLVSGAVDGVDDAAQGLPCNSGTAPPKTTRVRPIRLKTEPSLRTAVRFGGRR